MHIDHSDSFESHPLRERLSLVLVTGKLYPCTTKQKELQKVLGVQGIKLPNFIYKFSILERSHRLCGTSEDSFLLSIHALEAGFHLPLHHFFCSLLKDYKIALGQLSGFSWWITMM
ncbi:hypothetical protein PVK06_026988 [Gossypium arboreum]|uniref:Transposase (putative) gypsy type domain-containing protein n=1 Tax=Gossypium arboreum TaxID=29729 RepID=A0ABR0NZ45_GOSAR|nr:hypothetical protein PVK06_026988 [Gossypium arboreum]